MSNALPPEPVDIDPAKLHAGTFQLNPRAEEARRRRRWKSWAVLIAAFVTGYTAGRIARNLLHLPKPPAVEGFVLYVAIALTLIGAFWGVYALLARRSPPEYVAAPVGAFIFGFSVEVSG